MALSDQRKAQPLKGILAVRRISQRTAAAAVGCHPVHLCAVLNGERTASPDLKQRLAKYLSLTVADLFDDEQQPCCCCGRSHHAHA